MADSIVQEPATTASSRRPWNLRLALMVVAAALFGLGWFFFATAPDPERVAPAGEGVVVRSVETLRVEGAALQPAVEVAGVLEPRRDVKIYAETQGPVVEVGAEELDRVDEGAVLVQIDPLLAEVAVERAAAAVARNESELALARSNLARRRSLSARDVVSASALDDAENAERVAEAALRESRAELARARDDLANKTIRAPFTGVLRSFPVESGEYVREGQELGELLDLSKARVTVGLSDREIVAVRPGQPASISVEAYDGERFEGRVLRVGAASEADTRRFPVEIELPNADARLLPGMVARATLQLGEPVVRRLIPRDATLDEFGLYFVYVVESDADAGLVARRRRVRVAQIPFRPGDFEVLEGLEVGEEIAIGDIRQLRDGERVRRAVGGST